MPLRSMNKDLSVQRRLIYIASDTIMQITFFSRFSYQSSVFKQEKSPSVIMWKCCTQYKITFKLQGCLISQNINQDLHVRFTVIDWK